MNARQELEAMWVEVERGGGDDFHRCVIAHFMADLQDDDRAELLWDECALTAVDGVSDERAQEFHESLQVRGFMPSLYLSLADDQRRLSDASRAHEFLAKARATSDALGDDAHGELHQRRPGQGESSTGRGLDRATAEPMTSARANRRDSPTPSADRVPTLVSSRSNSGANGQVVDITR